MKDTQIKGKQYWLCYLFPMRLITFEGETISFTIEEINESTYNHAILCRIIGYLTNTYRNITIQYTVCGDGALLIDQSTGKFSTNDLILHFNDILCKILIGGINVEAVNNKDITTGFSSSKGMIWPVNFGHSFSSDMHAKIRMRLANNMETIYLDGACKSAKAISELETALSIGNSVITKIANISTYYLLTGITDLRYGNWSSALSNLWIVAEQLTDFLWETEFLADASKNPDIPSRLQSLRQDNRTYSASVKQEILFQLGIIPTDIYSELYLTRRARNKLVHEGNMADRKTAIGLYKAIKTLLSIASKQKVEIIPFFNNMFDVT